MFDKVVNTPMQQVYSFAKFQFLYEVPSNLFLLVA